MRYVLLDDQGSGRQKLFDNPQAIITANHASELETAFAQIDAAQAEGKWLAGWMSYELGHALDPHFKVPDAQPLIQIGVFEAPSDNAPIDYLYRRETPNLNLYPDWTEEDYLIRFQKVQAYLRAGDCYQVNLTFPLWGETELSPKEIYAAFRQRQAGRYGAVVDLSDTKFVSFSPELFFEKQGAEMRMRPMKGTRPRGTDDAAILAQMQAEPKSRAENLMIVDLLRNDLSRLCAAGSVKVPELFALETYPTLHQMTSQVTGRLRNGLSWRDIFTGLFPCGSITGAPKIRAMEIIKALENGPRGAYCGAIGFITPDGDATFSVAIRTLQMQGNHLRYDVGSGVVLDSDGPDEYRECLLKAQIFDSPKTGVIETFRRLPEGTIPREDLHLARAKQVVNSTRVDQAFAQIKHRQAGQDLRARIEFRDDGETVLTTTPLVPLSEPLRLALSKYPLSAAIQSFDQKTTQRDFYDGERARLKALCAADEVIFINTQSQICEGSFTSIFVEIDGQLYTPPLSAGLLPGVWRQALCDRGEVTERVLKIADLKTASAVYVGNSLREMMRATFIDYLPH